MESKAESYDILDAVSGTKWERVFEYENADGSPVDLSDFTPRGEIRDDDDNLLETLNFVVVGNKVTVSFTPATIYRGDYDIELVPTAGDPIYFVGGRVRVKRGITQP